MSGITLLVEDPKWRSHRGLMTRLTKAADATRRSARLKGGFTILLAGDKKLWGPVTIDLDADRWRIYALPNAVVVWTEPLSKAGAMYVLDYGKARIKDGQVNVESGSGKIYRLMPTRGPAGLNVP